MFYDIAAAGNNRLAGERGQFLSIGSVGAGLRWNIHRNFNIRFDLATVIDEGGSEQLGDLRGHLSVYLGF